MCGEHNRSVKQYMLCLLCYLYKAWKTLNLLSERGERASEGFSNTFGPQVLIRNCIQEVFCFLAFIKGSWHVLIYTTVSTQRRSWCELMCVSCGGEGGCKSAITTLHDQSKHLELGMCVYLCFNFWPLDQHLQDAWASPLGEFSVTTTAP